MPCEVDVTRVARLFEAARLLRAEAGEAVGVGGKTRRGPRSDRIGGRIADADRVTLDPPFPTEGDIERFDAADGQAIDEVRVEVRLTLRQAAEVEARRAGRPQGGVERFGDRIVDTAAAGRGAEVVAQRVRQVAA